MKIRAVYSHLGGAEILCKRFPSIESEIDDIVENVVPSKTKISKEKTKQGRLLYNPRELNRSFKGEFSKRGFKETRIDYDIPLEVGRAIPSFKQIDYNKGRVNVEVQFGKYAFMFYDMSKFQHFYNANKIDVGVEIVPDYYMMKEMSSGVSYGEQLRHDIERLHRSFPSVPVKLVMVGP